MAKGKGILLYLFVVLMAVAGNSAWCCPDYASPDKSSSLYTYVHEGHFVHPCFSERLTKEEWVKVRYMAGDCRFDTPYIVLATVQPEHAEKKTGSSYVSFISSACYFSFKLRGPPAGSLL